MVESGVILPRKRLSKKSKRSVLVEVLIKPVKDGLVVNVDGIFQKVDSLLLPLLVAVIRRLKSNSLDESLLKFLENGIVHDECGLGLFLSHRILLILLVMHVL